ncbi:hypothetical protein ACA910_010751 [Epithemia clementina (nom. ined.)]
MATEPAVADVNPPKEDEANGSKNNVDEESSAPLADSGDSKSEKQQDEKAEATSAEEAQKEKPEATSAEEKHEVNQDGVKPEATSAEEKQEENQDGAKQQEKQDEETALAAIVERLKFFFSDANARQDIFIRQLLLKDDGVVPIESLLKFNTVKQHTTDPKVVAKAVQSDALSDRLVLTDDSSGIKRVNPFTLTAMDDNIPLSLVVGNLPIKKSGDGKVFYAVKGDEIRELFQQYGEVALVKLRFGREEVYNPDSDLYSPKNNHKLDKVPRGSALVEFEKLEALEMAAEDVLTRKGGVDVEPKRKLAIRDNTLTVFLMREFIDELKKRLDNKEEPEDEESKKKKAGQIYKVDWKPGCVIKLDGLPESCDREEILDAVSKCLDKNMDEIKEMKIYVDYSRGQTNGAMRFQEPDGNVQIVLQKLQSGDIEIAGQKVQSAKLMEGDEEKKYWADFIDFKSKQKRQRQGSGGGRFRHKKKQRNS